MMWNTGHIVTNDGIWALLILALIGECIILIRGHFVPEKKTEDVKVACPPVG